MREGVLDTNNLTLQGDNNLFKIVSTGSTRDNLNMTFTAKMDLSLLSVFLPFATDLRGRLSANANIFGTSQSPQVQGSTFIEKALLKIKGFPHAFEDLNADILLTPKAININAVKAILGGGAVTGDGKVLIAGGGNIPVDVKGQFSNINVNIPEGYKTKGSGNVRIKGAVVWRWCRVV